MTAYRLRPAAAADAEQICRIYNQGIEDRVATLEVELRSPDERRQWLEGRGARHPVIVAEHDAGEIAGWASLNVFSPREAYRFVADISVYVERGWIAIDSSFGQTEVDATHIKIHAVAPADGAIFEKAARTLLDVPPGRLSIKPLKTR